MIQKKDDIIYRLLNLDVLHSSTSRSPFDWSLSESQFEAPDSGYCAFRGERQRKSFDWDLKRSNTSRDIWVPDFYETISDLLITYNVVRSVFSRDFPFANLVDLSELPLNNLSENVAIKC